MFSLFRYFAFVISLCRLRYFVMSPSLFRLFAFVFSLSSFRLFVMAPSLCRREITKRRNGTNQPPYFWHVKYCQTYILNQMEKLTVCLTEDTRTTDMPLNTCYHIFYKKAWLLIKMVIMANFL